MKHKVTLKKLGIFSFVFVLLLIVAYYLSDPSIVYSDKFSGFWKDSDNVAYETGFNLYGMKVFKDPEKAFEQAKIDYKEGFEAVMQQDGLYPISQESYPSYKTLAWQLYTDDPELKEQGAKISRFLDIYENSFTYGN